MNHPCHHCKNAANCYYVARHDIGRDNLVTCEDCGETCAIGATSPKMSKPICDHCRFIRRQNYGKQRPIKSPLAVWAVAVVNAAVRKGILPRITASVRCTDCGEPANCYDHRDYLKPLSVDPVCSACNYRRGRGKNRDLPAEVIPATPVEYLREHTA